MNIITLYRISNKFHKKGLRRLSVSIDRLSFLIFNSYVPGSAIIGEGSRCAYGGIGVVIHYQAKIGRNVIIGQACTIGRKLDPKGVPVIGDNVYISAGSRVLGDIHIGDNVIIGANSVVVSDVPSNSIVAGAPAKVIRTIDCSIYELLENID